MNVTCPHCGTVFRVDPAKIPVGGARARCSRCAGIFPVQSAEPAGSAIDLSQPPAPVEESRPDVESEPQPQPGFPTAPSAVAPAPAAPPVFGAADPNSRARRLARALISDIVVYYPERRERSMRSGSLRQEFREEIRKSWEEYTAQVGDQMARGTSYFRDALNEILAGGEPTF
jgi:predicted Zn finger-like uncharacterized protein